MFNPLERLFPIVQRSLELSCLNRLEDLAELRARL